MNDDITPTEGAPLQTIERTGEPEPETTATVSFGTYARDVLGRAGRRVASILRWWLLGLLIFAGPMAVLVWTVGPRVTDPQALVDKAIDLGLTDTARTTLIDQVVTQIDGETGLPVDTASAVDVLERGITQEWVNTQFTGFATNLDSWLALTGTAPPSLTVDLQPVKENVAGDPAALSIFERDPDCQGPGCTPPGELLQQLLGGIPDAVELNPENDPSGVATLIDGRSRLQTIGDVVGSIPRLLAIAVLLVVLFAPRGGRLRWFGAAVAVPAIPVLLIATLLPSFAAGVVSGSLPEVIPLDTQALEELLRWITAPARTLATFALIGGAAAFVAGSVLSFRSGWQEAQRA